MANSNAATNKLLAETITEAAACLNGGFEEREPGWFTIAEYAAQVMMNVNLRHIKARLDTFARNGKFESKRVRSWDITQKRRIIVTVYRMKKEIPNAKLDRSKRSIPL
jgi:hypothetical protein